MKKPTKAEYIKSFTSYAITFGVSINPSLSVMKLTLDFERNVLEYFQLCQYEWSSVHVDSAFQYVMDRIALSTKMY